MTTLLEEFENKETGVKSFVHHTKEGFKVSVQDIDSGEFLPTTVTYPDFDWAKNTAKGAAGVK